MQVTSEQEDYARGFTDALNLLHHSEHVQPDPQQPQPQQPSKVTSNTEFITTGTSIAVNTSLTTTSPPTTTSTILSTVGMSGGSVTYTNLGRFTLFFLLCGINLIFEEKYGSVHWLITHLQFIDIAFHTEFPIT